MTRQEEIRNAVDTIIPISPSRNGRTYEQALMATGFEAGVKWADNNICLSSIWNDTSIMPSDNKGIIYLTKNGKIGVIKAIKSNNWDWYVTDKYSIIKWAYIDDILPKQFGNSEQLKEGEKWHYEKR